MAVGSKSEKGRAWAWHSEVNSNGGCDNITNTTEFTQLTAIKC